MTHYEGLVADLRKHLALARAGGYREAVALHQKRGKLTARERIAKLLDPDASWLELSPLAAFGMYDDHIVACRSDHGIGYVSGRPCVIAAERRHGQRRDLFPDDDQEASPGCRRSLWKIDCLRSISWTPAGVLADAGRGLCRRDHFGRIFYNQARDVRLGIPQIAAVMGMCTAGGAYVPAMCDENVIVKDTGTIYLAGPPLVKAATGEDVTPKELAAPISTRGFLASATISLKTTMERWISAGRSLPRCLDDRFLRRPGDD